MEPIKLEDGLEDLRFEPKKSELNDLKIYSTDTGAYYVPRVTKLLDTVKEDYIVQWANSLGWRKKSYTKTLQEYAELGTHVHEDIEEFIRFGTEGVTPGWESFKIWWDKLNELNTVTNVMSEVELIGPYFGGTTDLFCKLNGYGCLIDFKTSKNIGYKYLVQLSAYTYLMKLCLNIDIRYCVILQVDKTTAGIYHVYSYDLGDPDIRYTFDIALQYIHNLAACYLQNRYIRTQFELTKDFHTDLKEWGGPDDVGNND